MSRPVWQVEARGDAAFALVSTRPFSLEQHGQLLAFVKRIDATKPAHVMDVVPGHTEILVQVDAGTTPVHEVKKWLTDLARDQPDTIAPAATPLLRVPVCFDREFGLDLAAVAAQVALTEAQVVEAFTSRTYHCTVMGFRPGFAYLEGVPEPLVLPRHASPRPLVPRGSVAIAGGQAGIYPVDGPGGWHVLGRSDVALFTPTRSRPCLIEPGTRVQFHAVDRDALADAT